MSEAMTSNRPYRPAMTTHAAIGELRQNQGTQFDPQLVIRFIDALHKHGGLEEATELDRPSA